MFQAVFLAGLVWVFSGSETSATFMFFGALAVHAINNHQIQINELRSEAGRRESSAWEYEE